MVSVDHRRGGPHVIRLPGAATLEVRLANPAVIERARRGHAGRSDFRLSIGPKRSLFNDTTSIAAEHAGPYVFPNLRAGHYELTLGGFLEVELARAAVDLDVGERCVVTLTLVEPPAEVPFSGTIFFPPEWGSMMKMELWTRVLHPDSDPIEDGEVIFQGVPMVAIDAAGGFYHWDAGACFEGRYRFSLSQDGLLDSYDLPTAVDLGPGGRTDVTLRVPEPARVILHLIDAATGEPARAVSCSGLPAPDARGIVRFTVPAGGFVLEAIDKGQARSSHVLSLVPGDNEISVRISAQCRVQLVPTERS